MTRDFHTIVLGLGGFGAGALYWLSRRLGSGVLGLEQFELGHVRGGSQDHSRIIRLSYHTPGYVELARHAYAAWREVEGGIGHPLILTTGGIDIGFEGCAIPLDDYEAEHARGRCAVRTYRRAGDQPPVAGVSFRRPRLRALPAGERTA